MRSFYRPHRRWFYYWPSSPWKKRHKKKLMNFNNLCFYVSLVNNNDKIKMFMFVFENWTWKKKWNFNLCRVSNELSGNVVDLCPVGALNNLPYSFQARPWELKSNYTIDVMDALGVNIDARTRGSDLLRILPRINEEVNEEWISDKSRHAFGDLKKQRLIMLIVKKSWRHFHWSDVVRSSWDCS